MHDVILGILERMPFQKNKIKTQLELMSKHEIEELCVFCDSLIDLILEKGLDKYFIINSYKELNNMMLKEQIYFKKKGKYRSENQDYVNDTLYSKSEKMLGHMISLALTQFLWKNHRLMMKYFKNNIEKYIVQKSKCLEIGAGHGLFTKEIFNVNKDIKIDIVDISETSIELSKQIIISTNKNLLKKINFIHQDITTFETSSKYDFISISEVLEHVDDPIILLKSLKDLISFDGVIYMTTCSNCPSIDHVYLFSNVSEIKKMILSIGLEIVDDLIISAEDISLDEALSSKTTLNYSAFLRIKR